MRCTFIKQPDGGLLVLCGSKSIAKCAFCRGTAGLECDWPLANKTCDKKLCRGCAVTAGKNVDFCPDHPVPAQAQLFAAD